MQQKLAELAEIMQEILGEAETVAFIDKLIASAKKNKIAFSGKVKLAKNIL